MKLSILSLTLLLSSIAESLIIPQQPLKSLGLEFDFEIASLSPDDRFDNLPLVTSDVLQSLITEDTLRERAEKLYDIAQLSNKSYGHPTRVIGSKGHWGTLGYIKKELHKLNGYYNVTVQPFKAFMSEIYAINATIDGVIPSSLTEMDMSPSTPHKKPVVGNLTLVKNSGCLDTDYDISLAGNIAFIKRGECAFGEKAQLAAKYGAKAAIIYNNEDGDIRGTLGVPPEGLAVAPTVGLSRIEGEKYLELLENGEILETIVTVDSFVGPITTLNIIAESKIGDANNTVMLGAHSDSVTAGPGINDDGSGTISLLEVAKQLSKYKVNNRVRFAWWAAEEEGLLGSNFYAETLSKEENSKIRLFMDYDMMASPNYEYEIYDANDVDNPKGSEELKNLYIDYYTGLGLNYTLIPFDGRSDYVGFIDHGIPGGGIAAGAEKENVSNGLPLDKCYHQLCDDLDNLAYEAFVINTKLIAHSVATYANSLKGFPERSEDNISAMHSKFKYRGKSLII